MQEDYRIRARSNVMTLTRTRARLSGNQIGVCSSRDRQFAVTWEHAAAATGLRTIRISSSGALEFGRCRGMADIGQAAPIRLD